MSGRSDVNIFVFRIQSLQFILHIISTDAQYGNLFISKIMNKIHPTALRLIVHNTTTVNHTTSLYVLPNHKQQTI